MAFGSHHHFDCILAGMTDWQAVAAALKAPIREDDRPMLETLEKLEESFRALQASIPHAATLWSGPSDLE